MPPDSPPATAAAPTVLTATIAPVADPSRQTEGCVRRFDVTAQVKGTAAAVMLFYREAGSGESGQMVMVGVDGLWTASVELPAGDYDVMVAATGPAGSSSGGARRVIAACDDGG